MYTEGVSNTAGERASFAHGDCAEVIARCATNQELRNNEAQR
jgi:hypothetical protein